MPMAGAARPLPGLGKGAPHRGARPEIIPRFDRSRVRLQRDAAYLRESFPGVVSSDWLALGDDRPGYLRVRN